MLAALAGVLAAPLAAQNTWIVPAVARTPGANGARWTTGLTMWNGGPTAVSLSVRFTPHDTDGRSGPERTLTLPPGAVDVRVDVLEELFGLAEGWGALRVTSSGLIGVLAQTSTPGASGTYGQSVPAVSAAGLVRDGAPGTIAGVFEDDLVRTNLALANAGLTPVDVEVALYSKDGALLGSSRVALSPLGMTQLTRVARVLGVPGTVASARLGISVTTPGGAVAAHATAIDAATNDPRTIAAEVAPARGLRIIPSVAHLPGEGGAVYTSDVVLPNPSASPATATLRLLPPDADGTGSPARTVSLASGETLVLHDVVRNLFGLPEGYGAVLVEASSNRAVASAATSTPAGGGALGTAGTFGQNVPAVPEESFIAADRPGTILGVREDGAFRTNLVLVSADATRAIEAEVTLVSREGATLASQRVALPPLGLVQVGRVVRALGVTGDVTGARLVVAAPRGSQLVAAATLIDALTNDPRPLASVLAPRPSPSGPESVRPCPVELATPLFGTSPVALEDFLAFRPLGFQSTPIHMFPAKHGAFSMTLPGAVAVPKPVRAPGSATVTEIYEASFSTGGRNYQVFLNPCRDVRVYVGHVVTLAPKLLAAFAAGVPTCNSFPDGTATVTTCRRTGLDVPLEEGEVFATGPDTAGVDFGLVDFRRLPAGFVDLSHYDSYYPYYASPLEYFTPEARRALEAKTGSVFGTRFRTAEPIGGTHMQDRAGTAQGNWFLPGRNHRNTTDLSVFIALAHDYVDPLQPVMALSPTVKNARLGLSSYSPEASGFVNRDFSAIRADGNVYCFDRFLTGQTPGGLPLLTPDGVLILSLPSDTQLRVELVPGASCAAVAPFTFTANAVMFER